MIIRIRIGHFRLTWTFAQVEDIIGVNSLLLNGEHILLWDFDNVPLIIVETALAWVQSAFGLPKIYILDSGKKDHYMAYCFERCSWKQAVAIIATTDYVDPYFFKWGVFRRRFTLRVTPKSNRRPKLISTLQSGFPETASISELKSWVKSVLCMLEIGRHNPQHTILYPQVPQVRSPKIRNAPRYTVKNEA